MTPDLGFENVFGEEVGGYAAFGELVVVHDFGL
jgi:hypothetical protein